MSESKSERTVVKTYVPAEQKAAWVEHADELGMSQSEFVRSMVQAGRADFAVDPYPELDAKPTEAAAGAESTASETTDDGGMTGDDGDEFEDRVFELLRGDTHSWEELLEAVTEDVEDRLENALQSLQAENRVVYSGRNGGYEAIEE